MAKLHELIEIKTLKRREEGWLGEVLQGRYQIKSIHSPTTILKTH